VDDSFDLSCNQPLLQPNEQLYAMDAHTDDSVNFTQMNSSWTVPRLPANGSTGTVFLWPGFKAQQPEPGYPVLQPVLQYGQRRGQYYWELQSWFVWAKHFLLPVSVTGKAIKVAAGDNIVSYMNFDDSTQLWTVYAKNARTGEESTLQVTKKKTGNMAFPYAMHVLETVMPATGYCNEYPPGGGVAFHGISANGGANVQWITRAQKTDCQQKVTVSKTGDTVNFAWSSAAPALVV
jgi:hypothetical protein